MNIIFGFFMLFTGLASLVGSYLVKAFVVVLVSTNNIAQSQISAMGIEAGIFILWSLAAVLFGTWFAVDRLKK